MLGWDADDDSCEASPIRGFGELMTVVYGVISTCGAGSCACNLPGRVSVPTYCPWQEGRGEIDWNPIVQIHYKIPIPVPSWGEPPATCLPVNSRSQNSVCSGINMLHQLLVHVDDKETHIQQSALQYSERRMVRGPLVASAPEQVTAEGSHINYF